MAEIATLNYLSDLYSLDRQPSNIQAFYILMHLHVQAAKKVSISHFEFCHKRYKTKNDRRNSGGTLRQKETKNALKTS